MRRVLSQSHSSWYRLLWSFSSAVWSKSRKIYGVIFTCLVIRVMHIKVAFSLDTDFFLLALRRFIARRGQVKDICSDNGTNFASDEKELRQSTNAWNQAKIHEDLMQRNIK